MSDTKQGVFYELGDYAGICRRMLIVVVDLTMMSIIFFGVLRAAQYSVFISNMFGLCSFAACYTYMAVLKATPLGTIGYLIAGVRLSNLQGRRASIWRSSFRFGFFVLGPFNMLIDIIWLGGDPNRQSIRDKFAGTYVVRRTASPAGSGPIEYKLYLMFAYSLVFAEVNRTPKQPQDE
jgi:uncharacterized RDD family membrane protein YckC